MSAKVAYRIKNWSEYNKSLVNRGSLTIWFDDVAITNWYASSSEQNKRGRKFTYSDLAIETALTLRSLYHLSLRAAKGFVHSITQLLKLDIVVPCYTTFSRRSNDLPVEIKNKRHDISEPLHLVIDATGLKVFGEGEWKMRTHGKAKRRVWRKLHLCINRETKEIESLTLTPSNVHDSIQTKALLDQIDYKVSTVTGDMGYDNRNAYGPIAKIGARAIIPPRSGAALKLKKPTWGDVERNRLIREKHLLGKEAWKVGSGYTKRVHVENTIGRFKKIIGPGLRALKFQNQVTESKIGAKIINKMTNLGMPKSYKL